MTLAHKRVQVADCREQPGPGCRGHGSPSDQWRHSRTVLSYGRRRRRPGEGRRFGVQRSGTGASAVATTIGAYKMYRTPLRGFPSPPHFRLAQGMTLASGPNTRCGRLVAGERGCCMGTPLDPRAPLSPNPRDDIGLFLGFP